LSRYYNLQGAKSVAEKSNEARSSQLDKYNFWDILCERIG